MTLGELLDQILSSTAINLHGFYSHAGNAYASTSLPEATSHLSSEVSAVNAAAEIALDRLPKSPYKDEHSQPFILSVGSTPTAHAAGEEARNILAKVLHGALELHAGKFVRRRMKNLSLTDKWLLLLRQLSTSRSATTTYKSHRLTRYFPTRPGHHNIFLPWARRRRAGRGADRRRCTCIQQRYGTEW